MRGVGVWSKPPRHLMGATSIFLASTCKCGYTKCYGMRKTRRAMPEEPPRMRRCLTSHTHSAPPTALSSSLVTPGTEGETAEGQHTEAEQQRILAAWNNTAAPYPTDRCMNQLFEEQVARTPDATALIFEDQRWTYGELNRRANQLAHHLRALGVGPETLVGICTHRSPAMLVGMLGILKAGGAYVAL